MVLKFDGAIGFISTLIGVFRMWLLKGSLENCKDEIDRNIKESEERICKKIDEQKKDNYDNILKVLAIVSNMIIKEDQRRR